MKESGDVAAVLGAKVKQAREARGWSQERLAEKLSDVLQRELKPLTVLRLEKGTRPTTVPELRALADVFGVSAAALIGEENEQDLFEQLQFQSIKARSQTGHGHIRQGVEILVDVSADARAFLEHDIDQPGFMRGTVRTIATHAERAVKRNSPTSDIQAEKHYRPGEDVPEA